MGRVFLPHMDAFFEIWVGFSCLRIGVSDLYHSGGAVGLDAGDAVGAADAGIAAVDVGAAVLAAEHRPLAEDRQTVQGGGPSGPNHRIRQDPVVEGHIDAVMIAVKDHRLYLDAAVEKLCAPYPDTGTAVQQGLGAGG